jgi:NTE family protein
MRAGGRLGGSGCLVVWLLAGCALLSGCAAPRAYLGEPITATREPQGYRMATVLRARGDDDLLFLLSLSGGGMRASTMAYGVLEQLAADSVDRDGHRSRLLDEVDVISAVSGGAVPAAYYVLYGDRLFEDFTERFLVRDITATLSRRILWSPSGWLRLGSREYSRGDAYAEFFDRELFHGATFADLDTRGNRPFLIINSTEVGLAARFEFTQDNFDGICGDLSRFPIARAVAASSLVPALLTPITVRNYASACDHGESITSTAKSANAWLPWLHLVDGALSDNLGARAMLDALADGDDHMQLRHASTSKPVRRIVYLSVNAGDAKSMWVGQHRQSPPALQMLRLMGTVPVDRYTAESKLRLRAALEAEARELHAELHYIEIEIDSLRAEPEFAALVELPTSFDLQPDAMRALHRASRRLLAQSPEYQRLLEAFREP